VSGKVKRYRVTAACVVHVPVVTQAGPALGTLYRDAVFTADPDSEKVAHLLGSGMVEEIGDDGQLVASGPPAPAKASAAKASAAKAETGQGAGSGSQAPQVTARSTKAELVDHAVAQGVDRGEAEKLTVKELQERYVRQQ
jgi:hypothetical protein